MDRLSSGTHSAALSPGACGVPATRARALRAGAVSAAAALDAPAVPGSAVEAIPAQMRSASFRFVGYAGENFVRHQEAASSAIYTALGPLCRQAVDVLPTCLCAWPGPDCLFGHDPIRVLDHVPPSSLRNAASDHLWKDPHCNNAEPAGH